MSNGTNTFVVSGNAGLCLPLTAFLLILQLCFTNGVLIPFLPPQLSETKSIADIAPSILKQLNQEQLAKLLAQQQSAVAEGNMPSLTEEE